MCALVLQCTCVCFKHTLISYIIKDLHQLQRVPLASWHKNWSNSKRYRTLSQIHSNFFTLPVSSIYCNTVLDFSFFQPECKVTVLNLFSIIHYLTQYLLIPAGRRTVCCFKVNKIECSRVVFCMPLTYSRQTGLKSCLERQYDTCCYFSKPLQANTLLQIGPLRFFQPPFPFSIYKSSYRCNLYSVSW